jgi:hypothetical protein
MGRGIVQRDVDRETCRHRLVDDLEEAIEIVTLCHEVAVLRRQDACLPYGQRRV